MAKDLKAVLSNRIFLSYSKDLLDHIKKELTYKLPPKRPGGKPEMFKTYNLVSDRAISIPIGRTDLIPEGYTIIDKRTEVEAFFPETVDDFIKKLRPSQKEAYKLVNGNYIINAKPGWGKTFTAIAIITKLLQKALVIVHTVDLREQWETEIEATLGFKPGIIGSGKYNIDSSIVVANVQSLRKHMDNIRHAFGTIILDECHHTPATSFSNFLNASTAKYKIGLSGTVHRKDGKHVLMFDYITPKLFVPPKENVLEPIVLIYKSDLKIPGNHLVPWPTRVNNLTNSPAYKETIKKFADAQAARGHKVLIVSDRVEFLHDLAEGDDRAICITSKVDNRKELLESLKGDKIDKLYGSISIFKEGISNNVISCLIIATPVSNEYLMIQLVGRIIRKSNGKMRPEVVDIAFAGDTGKRQLTTRMRAYRREGYEVRYIN